MVEVAVADLHDDHVVRCEVGGALPGRILLRHLLRRQQVPVLLLHVHIAGAGLRETLTTEPARVRLLSWGRKVRFNPLNATGANIQQFLMLTENCGIERVNTLCILTLGVPLVQICTRFSC